MWNIPHPNPSAACLMTWYLCQTEWCTIYSQNCFPKLFPFPFTHLSLILNVSEVFIWLEVELIKTTLTTLIIFCYRNLTEIEVMKFKLNIFTLLKHCYLLIQSKEKLEYSCKYSDHDKTTFSERKLFLQNMTQFWSHKYLFNYI